MTRLHIPAPVGLRTVAAPSSRRSTGGSSHPKRPTYPSGGPRVYALCPDQIGLAPRVLRATWDNLPDFVSCEGRTELRGCLETKPLSEKILGHMRGKAKNGLTE